MTKEEKALREWPEAMKMNGSQINLFYKEVRAMRRAIIEECAKVAGLEKVDYRATGDHGDEIYNRAIDDAIAAIRRMR